MAHKDKNQRLQEKYQAILSGMLREEENKYCADCDSKGPRWTSWNLGIFLCIRCAGIHRKLGVHISKVKSINLDQWTAEQVASMQAAGNSKAKAIYEHSLSDNYRRSQSDTAMEQFIRAKYEQQKWILPGYKPQAVIIPPDLYEDDRDSAKKASTKQIELPKPPEFKKSENKVSTTNRPANPPTTGVVAKPAVVDNILFSFDDNEPNLFGGSGQASSSSSSGINQVAPSSAAKSNLDEIESEFKSTFVSPSVESSQQQSNNLFGGPDKTIDNIMAMFKTMPTSQSAMNMSGLPTSSSTMNIGNIGPSILPSSNSSFVLNQQQYAQPNNHFQGLSDPFANNNNNNFQRGNVNSTAANSAFANLIPSNFNSAPKMTNSNMFPSQQQGQQFPNLFAPTTTNFGMTPTPSSTTNPAANNNLFSNTLSSDLWQ